MMLELSIENDRAFAEENEFSLVPSRLKDVGEGRILSAHNAAKTRALSSAVILGKNGSGKTTLISSIGYLAGFVADSANESQAGEDLQYTPNELIPGWDQRPTKYRILFSVDKAVYEFGFSFVKSYIVDEYLKIADDSVRFSKVYTRSRKDNGHYTYSFGDTFTGQRSTWVKSTRENALFLSTAVQLNSENLKIPFEWLVSFIRVISAAGEENNRKITGGICTDDPHAKKKVVAFLRAFDINVADFEIEERSVDEDFLRSTFNEAVLSSIREVVREKANYKVTFLKTSQDGSLVQMPISRESAGTQALFGLAGPILESLKHGYCLFVDEINLSLHPSVVDRLVDLFSDPAINRKRAQLIFTTHDTSILSQKKLRRDQVWIVENDGMQAHLIPLSDYSPRRGEALDKGYLGGRYGGIPSLNLGQLRDLLIDAEA